MWGAQPVRRALAGVNWANGPLAPAEAAGDDSGGVPYLRGALPVRQFLRLVNWPNAADPPDWPVREGAASTVGLQSSVESLFEQINWGD